MRLFQPGISPLRRIGNRLKLMRQGRLKSFEMYLPYVCGKSGLEIGGPSGIFRKGNPLPLYEEIGSWTTVTFPNLPFGQSTPRLLSSALKKHMETPSFVIVPLWSM